MTHIISDASHAEETVAKVLQNRADVEILQENHVFTCWQERCFWSWWLSTCRYVQHGFSRMDDILELTSNKERKVLNGNACRQHTWKIVFFFSSSFDGIGKNHLYFQLDIHHAVQLNYLVQFLLFAGSFGRFEEMFCSRSRKRNHLFRTFAFIWEDSKRFIGFYWTTLNWIFIEK